MTAEISVGGEAHLGRTETRIRPYRLKGKYIYTGQTRFCVFSSNHEKNTNIIGIDIHIIEQSGNNNPCTKLAHGTHH
jgi:hypothetical protein